VVRSRFPLIVVASALIVMTATGLANWAMDPFGRFGRPAAGYYFETERDIKQGLVRHRQFDGLLMGSSKVAEWQPASITSYRVINAAWSAAVPEELEAFLRDVEPQAAFVALGLDLFMFNSNGYPRVEESPFLAFTPATLSTHLLSLDMLQRGLWVRDQELARRRPWVLGDGARNTAADEAADRLKPRDNTGVLERLRGRIYGQFRFDDRRFDHLRGVKAWSEDHCVALVTFLNPMSTAVLSQLPQIGADDDLARFRAGVRAVFPDVIDLTMTLSDEDHYWRADPDHYYPSVGTRIFNEHVAPRLHAADGGGRCQTPARS
jgi:hypothetical protein